MFDLKNKVVRVESALKSDGSMVGQNQNRIPRSSCSGSVFNRTKKTSKVRILSTTYAPTQAVAGTRNNPLNKCGKALFIGLINKWGARLAKAAN
jgi:hypothetical protein